jgi:hypothetical protein
VDFAAAVISPEAIAHVCASSHIRAISFCGIEEFANLCSWIIAIGHNGDGFLVDEVAESLENERDHRFVVFEVEPEVIDEVLHHLSPELPADENAQRT